MPDVVHANTRASSTYTVSHCRRSLLGSFNTIVDLCIRYIMISTDTHPIVSPLASNADQDTQTVDTTDAMQAELRLEQTPSAQPRRQAKLHIGFIITALVACLIAAGLYMRTQQVSAKNAEAQSDVGLIHSALEQYYVQRGNYPSQISSTALPMLKTEALVAPEGSYGYRYEGEGCSGYTCSSYTLRYQLIGGGGEEIVVHSLR